MEVSQFTYFQQVGGIECDPVSTELTYGLERLAMYVEGVKSVFDLDYNGVPGAGQVTYGDVFQRAEREFSTYNFEIADTATLVRHFADAERECGAVLDHGLALPAYDQCLKASHLFNLLDARGAISVTERAAYILGCARWPRAVVRRGWPMVRVPASDMGELLLELLSEEIPARMQRRAIEDLTGLLRDKLAGAEIPAAELRGYVTPRRLAVIAEGIPRTQPDRIEERRGPRVGAPPQAIEGFLRSAGLGSIDECEIRDTGRGEFYFAVIKRSGRPAAEVLPDLIKAAIAELPWPKSMRWPGSRCAGCGP